MKNQQGKNNGNYRHGMWGTSIYARWKHIKARCYNSNGKQYKDYGGRGIRVCDEWLDKENGFMNFYNWAMENGYREDLTIDRIDNNGNYEPDNCRWVSHKVQNNNTRRSHRITYNGETHSLTEWSKILNIKLSTLSNRINIKKWSINKAFEKSVENGKKINQYDLNGNFIKQWDKISDAFGSKKTPHIIDCCKRKRKQAFGYIWRYVNETND